MGSMMRFLVRAALLVGLAAGAVDAVGAEPRRPNILWIIAEDLGPDLACSGNPAVRTPHLDRLAAEGARFTRAYATAPVCSPSRSAFNTGMDQIFLGAHHHRSHRKPGDANPPPEGVRLVSHRLQDAGYFTANVTDFPADVAVKPPALGKTDWNLTIPREPFQSRSWSDLARRQPFYAQVNLWQTHRPFPTAPRREIDPATVVLPPYVPDHPKARKDWAGYLESMEELDDNVGAILAQLDKEGLRDDTIVFFFGDNGRNMLRGKTFLFESGVHVPLIVRWPGHVTPGEVRADLVSLVDLVPTALELAGVPVPPGMHGRPFLGPNAERRECVFAARDRIEESVDRVRSVITDRHHYIRNFMPGRPAAGRIRAEWREAYNPGIVLLKQLHDEGALTPAQDRIFLAPRPEEELYDLEKDPHELVNLAGSPEHREVLQQLRSRLDGWLKTTQDRGAVPENPAAVQAVEEMWIKKFGP